MEGQPINLDEYLKKVENAEFKAEEELKESLTRISEPFKHIESSVNSVEISEGGVKIQIAYGPYTFTKDGDVYIANSGQVINVLNISTEGRTIDLLGLLESGTKIIVYPNSDEEHGNITISEDGIRNIVIQGKINSPKMIAILLHEMGHILDFKKLDELGVQNLFDDGENSDIAEEIRRERFATAFTLKVLRPFLKDKVARQDMLNLLKHSALESYYYSAKKKLEKRKEAVAENYLGHGFDDYLNDDSKYFS